MTDDISPSMLQYLLSLTPEEAAEAVRSLPKEARAKLVGEVCGAVQSMSEAVVQLADELWENR